MGCTFLIALLTIQTSASQNIEVVAKPGLSVDTIQWWIEPDKFWRVKTYAIDLDLHIQKVSPYSGDAVLQARENINASYGDVIDKIHEFSFPECKVTDEVIKAFRQAGLVPNFETWTNGPLFWRPDAGDYFTKVDFEDEIRKLQ